MGGVVVDLGDTTGDAMADPPQPPSTTPNPPPRSRVILQKMLERLFASLVSGPGMNCRPHSSRQRVDVAQLGRLGL